MQHKHSNLNSKVENNDYNENSLTIPNEDSFLNESSE